MKLKELFEKKSYRSLETEKAYEEFKHEIKFDGVGFDLNHNTVVKETSRFIIMRNKFGYDYWDFKLVSDHLLIFPRRFITTLSLMTYIEKREYSEYLAEYIDKGYDIYTRADTNLGKSVRHVHTHLIKTGEFIS